MKHTLIAATALLGALATSDLAHADHPTRRETPSYRAHDQFDVIGRARLTSRRGEVSFTVTPEQRRDGLQLASNTPDLRILAIELVYSDGRVERLRGRALRTAFRDGALITIQRGRPPGLRHVHVRYALPRYTRRAALQLVQLHTGDGYTHERDLWNRPDHRDGGWTEYDPYRDDRYEYDGYPSDRY
jgi:hypothetical protein